MIKIFVEGTLSCPIFNCDVCGDMIGDINEGQAIYTHPEGPAATFKIDVQHVHKHHCREVAERKLNFQCDSQSLAAHLYFLCVNTGLDSQQFEKLKRTNGARAK